VKERKTPAQRAQVHTLAAQGLLSKDIAQATGIPRRTVSRILAQPADAAVIRVLTEGDVTEKVRELEQSFLTRMETLAADPKTPPRDVIRAYEVLAEQRALRTGSATQNLSVHGSYSEAREEGGVIHEFANQLADSLDALQELAESRDPEATRLVADWLLGFADIKQTIRDELHAREEAIDGRLVADRPR